MSHSRSRPARFALTPVALLVAGVVVGLPAIAQDAGEPTLRASPRLREDIPAQARPQLPTFVEADRLSGRTELDTSAQGNAVLRRGDTVIRADSLDYWQPDDLARARGNVRVNRQGNVFEGPEVQLKLESFEGFFTAPSYRFLRSNAYGQASRIDFLDDKRAVIRDSTYTTCQREDTPAWQPAWLLTADQISVDNEQEVGLAKGAVLRFFGVPVLPVPALSFPLSDKRKSGLLPPVIALNNISGVELTQPYYWDIAPNRDATISPTVMSRRGVNLGGEFRYLEADYRGQLRASLMPEDRLRQDTRWSYSLQHEQPQIRSPLPGATSLSLNFNRVSDDNFWRDFTRNSPQLTQRLLPIDGVLNWSSGNFGVTARSLKWQTLQDATAPIVPPYDRMPQLQGRYSRSDLPGGLVAYAETDYTRFESNRTLTGQPNAGRGYALAQLSRPWQAPGWFITPRLQLHSTHYQFDAPLAANGAQSASRTVPTFSLDSGLVFERQANYFGRNLTQTLEPRAFYVNTPWRDQSHLPNYDSGQNDFNFATVFTENAFGGHDRIADNRLLTVGATSRLQDAASGAELARLAIAQRLRFADQRVTLPGGTPVSERLSDLLLGASVNWSPQWAFDSTVQYNPKTSRSIRSTVGGRYNPAPMHALSAAYRLQRGLSEQIDIGWQWPIDELWGGGRASTRASGGGAGPVASSGAGRWYSVGRLNMSLKDGRVVDTILGLEYDGCCWVGRVVFERLQAGSSSANKRILFQLEFVGFSRLGSNALGTLRQNIPRYQLLHEQAAPPSRFTNYD